MTKQFCDKCGAEASNAFTEVTEKVGEWRSFNLRTIFEMIEEPAPCGSIGLSNPRISPADICRGCQIAMIESLLTKLKP